MITNMSTVIESQEATSQVGVIMKPNKKIHQGQIEAMTSSTTRRRPAISLRMLMATNLLLVFPTSWDHRCVCARKIVTVSQRMAMTLGIRLEILGKKAQYSKYDDKMPPI
jgi:hypothetical protein